MADNKKTIAALLFMMVMASFVFVVFTDDSRQQ